MKKWLFLTILLISFCFAQDFGYTGGVQSFSVPSTGWYKLEVWGAEAGPTWSGNGTGGTGGYSVGYKYLSQGTTLYVVVGGQGQTTNLSAWQAGSTGGYNGGGGTSTGKNPSSRAGGGGATHIATTNRGVLSNYASYQSEVLIVAGGGGGGEGGGPQAGGNGNSGGGGSFGQGSGAWAYNYSSGGGGGWSGGTSYGNGYASGGGTGYTGGVTSWNGNSPSMTAGGRSGSGYARITQVFINVTIPTLTNTSKTYNEAWQSPTVNYYNSGLMTQSGTSSAINAGTYTISWALKDTTTYRWADGTFGTKSASWTIARLNTASASASDKTYNEQTQTGVAGSYVTWTGTTSATDAGSYTAYATPTSNYAWSDGTTGSKTITWSIARAKTATASASDKIYNEQAQTGATGSYVTWTGTTSATTPGTYTAYATPDSNHAWSDGTYGAVTLTWSIIQNWNRYVVNCLVDPLGNPIQKENLINLASINRTQAITFDVKVQDTSTVGFCVGKGVTSSNINYNGSQSGIYYWENNVWVKK